MPAAAIADSSLKVDGQIDELRLRKDIVSTVDSAFTIILFLVLTHPLVGLELCKGLSSRVAPHT